MNALQLCRWQFSNKETLQQTFFKRSVILQGKWLFLGSLAAMYNDHLRLIGKHGVDFLLVLTELFLLGATAEALQASIDWKSAISLQRGRLTQNFR